MAHAYLGYAEAAHMLPPQQRPNYVSGMRVNIQKNTIQNWIFVLMLKQLVRQIPICLTATPRIPDIPWDALYRYRVQKFVSAYI